MKGRSRDKTSTRRKLLEAFSGLVPEKSYFDVTVNEVAEAAGISTSSFYTYFKSKDELLSHYMSDSLGELGEAFDHLVESSPNLMSVIRGLIYVLSTLMNDKYLHAFHRVFRELEFIDMNLSAKYYRRLLGLVEGALEKADPPASRFGVPLEVVSMAIVGSAQFIHLFRSIFRVEGDMLLDVEAAGDLVLKGFGPTSAHLGQHGVVLEVEPLHVLAGKYGAYAALASKESQRRILEAALKVLSRKTFREAKVFEICGEAGYAVGMFYKVYRGKNDLLLDVVKIIGRVVRHFLTECTSTAKTALELQILGTQCFLDFVSLNSQIYRIVRESEYVDIGIAKAYYLPFMKNYADRLAEAANKGQIITHNPGSLAITLMGINHLAGIIGPMHNLTQPETLVEGLTKLYAKGLLRQS